MEAAVERAGNMSKNIAILTLPDTKIRKSLPVNSWIRKDRETHDTGEKNPLW